jgi:hypothetical protein
MQFLHDLILEIRVLCCSSTGDYAKNVQNRQFQIYLKLMQVS